MDTARTVDLISPIEGVRPPSLSALHSSTLVAPAAQRKRGGDEWDACIACMRIGKKKHKITFLCDGSGSDAIDADLHVILHGTFTKGGKTESLLLLRFIADGLERGTTPALPWPHKRRRWRRGTARAEPRLGHCKLDKGCCRRRGCNARLVVLSPSLVFFKCVGIF